MLYLYPWRQWILIRYDAFNCMLAPCWSMCSHLQKNQHRSAPASRSRPRTLSSGSSGPPPLSRNWWSWTLPRCLTKLILTTVVDLNPLNRRKRHQTTSQSLQRTGAAADQRKDLKMIRAARAKPLPPHQPYQKKWRARLQDQGAVVERMLDHAALARRSRTPPTRTRTPLSYRLGCQRFRQGQTKFWPTTDPESGRC